jgi:hypothetical protein
MRGHFDEAKDALRDTASRGEREYTAEIPRLRNWISLAA